ncbi:MAG: CARDB domain-containing protein [Planctomycetota bacterium]
MAAYVSATFTICFDPVYRIDVAVNPAGAGTVGSANPGWWRPGEAYTAVFTPLTDWVHTGWSGDVTGASGPMKITVQGPVRLTAECARYQVPSGDGVVWSWGTNYDGQLGIGSRVSKQAPVAVFGLNDVVSVSAAGTRAFAVKADGTVLGWGDNADGYLCDGTKTDRYLPVPVPSLAGVRKIASGGGHLLALKSDGTVLAWGENSNGEIGDGTTLDRAAPAQVPGLSGVVSIAGGANSSHVADGSGSVWAWGSSGSGQLGTGSYNGVRSPVRVPTLSGIQAVAAGSYHAIALASDGTVWAWGSNQYGQLGDGTNLSRPSPGRVSGLSGVKAIAAANDSSLALKADGTVWGWGFNGSGQLGDGTTTSRSSPVQADTISNATAIAMGGQHTLILRGVAGNVYACGAGGSVGDGTGVTRLVPVAVAGIAGIESVSAGGNFNLVLKRNRPPLALDQSVTTAEDVTKAIVLAGTDPDGDALTYRIVAPPSRGTLVGTPPNLTYFPSPNVSGIDAFAFVANDGRADSAPATVSISVTPVNDPPVPVAVLSSANPFAGESVTFDARGSTDVEGPIASYAWNFGDGSSSSLALTTHAYAAPGAYTATLTVTDAGGASRSTTVSVSASGFADLVVDSVSGTFGGSPAGATTSATCTIRNAGTLAASKAFTVSLYLSADGALDASDFLLGGYAVNSLNPGSSQTKTVSFATPATVPGGSYKVLVWVDSGNTVAEHVGETNNVRASAASVALAPVDLIVSSVSGTLAGTPLGSSLTFACTVKNHGTSGTAATITVNGYLSLDGTYDVSDVLLGKYTVAGLAAGASSSKGVSFATPTKLVPGSYRFLAVVDATSAVFEPNGEANNVGASAAAAPFRPDFCFSSFSAKISSGKISISDAVKNQGSAATSGAYSVAFYGSTDATLDAGDVLLGTRKNTSILSIGGSNSATSLLSPPPAMPPGSYRIIGVVDADDSQAESNEGNNRATYATALSIKPDLAVDALSAVRMAGTLFVTSRVKNLGVLPNAAPFRVDFFLSADSTITTGDLLLGSRTVSAALAYGATDSATVQFEIPPTLAPGSRRVGVIVDAGGAVPELLETNNAAATSSLDLKPDLVPVSVVVSAAGRTVTMTETVRNDGALPAKASFVVDLRLSSDVSISTSDPLLGRRTVAANLAPGAASTGVTIWTAPASLAAGKYYGGTIVDGTGTISEISETNNKKASSASVSIGP